MNKLEYVRVSPFFTEEELRKAERKKTRLENLGYALINSSPSVLTYRLT
jgi:hypothetical protein